MRVRAAHRGFTAQVLALGLSLADTPRAQAQEAARATPVAPAATAARVAPAASVAPVSSAPSVAPAAPAAPVPSAAPVAPGEPASAAAPASSAAPVPSVAPVVPVAPAAQVEGPAIPEPQQIATEAPRRPRRPPVDPATRELRQTRGILAGGIVLTAVCGAGFGLFTYAVVDAGRRLQGQSGGRAIAAGGALLACTVVSIAAIGVGAKRLRTLKSRGRVAWAGGFGLHF